MKLRRFFLLPCILALCCGCSTVTSAQLQLFFESAIQSARPGETLTYSGNLTNLGSETVFLNGDTYDFSAENITLDDSAFLANAPVSLAAGESSDLFPMFSLTIGSNAIENTHPGAFTVLGGSTETAQLELVSQNFAVQVVPAPSGLIVSVVGFMPAMIWLRRRYNLQSVNHEQG